MGSGVWVQADQEEQVVKLVVPTVACMPLVMGLNFPKESALVILPHGLWGPLHLLGERYLFGESSSMAPFSTR